VGSQSLWRYSRETLPRRPRHRWAALRDPELKTARAWAIQEDLRRLWSYPRPAAGRRHGTAWSVWAAHARLVPVIAVARMLPRRLPGIRSGFRHRLTNAGSESLTSRIQAVRTAARGSPTASISGLPSPSTAAVSTAPPRPTQFPDEPANVARGAHASTSPS